ncbi:MAG: hypothetical protein D3913_00650 [Candidatus Electrothrix sp. LOE1_4_5]|nr:hypothetical protein [Candidatus Electrothrix gigas]
MKLIVSADSLSIDKDGFWLQIVSKLKKIGFEIPYWIGLDKPSAMPQDVFFHETIDAYKLVNLYNCKKELFDIDLLTTDEYYNYLKILDRADLLGGYPFSLRDRLLKEQLTYWHSVLLDIKPDCILFSVIPHALTDYPLYLVAQKKK